MGPSCNQRGHGAVNVSTSLFRRNVEKRGVHLMKCTTFPRMQTMISEMKKIACLNTTGRPTLPLLSGSGIHHKKGTMEIASWSLSVFV